VHSNLATLSISRSFSFTVNSIIDILVGMKKIKTNARAAARPHRSSNVMVRADRPVAGGSRKVVDALRETCSFRYLLIESSQSRGRCGYWQLGNVSLRQHDSGVLRRFALMYDFQVATDRND
jgi:hypothetical protein